MLKNFIQTKKTGWYVEVATLVLALITLIAYTS